ncbi:DUF2268 domain-containing putative Zn-dependent protease [Massilia alkalitolerans]|uniref:DUF2268 domain-containing putative Zn-dependent protease n=1 Tax=Massilia alkalitolerans TaxID=286638 RepID=UPI0028ABB919|nr:DUF2268 domain-containing putative Zn-dependent protease [Massilia alkalitolerans]
MPLLPKLLLACCAILPLSAAAQFTSRDVTRFYQVYDAASGQPTAASLQQGYLDGGSEGLHGYIPHRIVSADNLAQQVRRQPAVYADARSCLPVMDAMKDRVPAMVARMKGLYPAGRDPRVTVLIGGANSGGTVAGAEVLIGLEVACANRAGSTLPADERFAALIAHELVHTQQRGFAGRTLLDASLNEGVAELVGELLSGRILNEHLRAWSRADAAAAQARFRAAMHETELKDWIYNGVGTPESPGDLGYLFGYLIAKAYYERTPDKAAAVARLLEETDAKALLRDSGW